MSVAAGAVDGRKVWDGARLREIRIFRGMSQADLAAMSRIGQSEVSRHERNAPASNPTVAAMGVLRLRLTWSCRRYFSRSARRLAFGRVTDHNQHLPNRGDLEMRSRVCAFAFLLLAMTIPAFAQSTATDSPVASKPPATKLGEAADDIGDVVIKEFIPIGRTAYRMTTAPVVFEAAIISRPDTSEPVRGMRVTVSDNRISRASLIDFDEMGTMIKALDFMIAKLAEWKDVDKVSYNEISFSSRDDFKIGFYQEGKKQTGFATVGIIGAVTSTFNVSDLPNVRDLTQQALDLLMHPESAASSGAAQ
ncbi:MAG TPA: helix-turn-helix transcriptional regulator [Vicinamibacterales bacterium]|jgi:hypothetical protein|nr:helix-turn-helix transcriptional regulator [Vicinamibacterales bacterium]